MSHLFVERLIGTLRRELLDKVLFWNASDLERKLADFRLYYNSHRAHTTLEGASPEECSEKMQNPNRRPLSIPVEITLP
jgi:putative transposase